MSAWMPLQGIDMGSEQLLSLSWQIQFYPDKKNTTGRKLRQLLKEEKILTQGQMASQSVAVQGLGALEWLLFDKASNITDSKNCALASQISTYLSSTAKQYHGAWAVNPFSGANDKAQVKNSLSALSHQLDRVMKKLSMPLGKPGLSKPFQAEAWRSAQSLNFLRDSVSSMKVLYDADLRELLVQRGADDLANRIDEHWDTALESIPQQPGMKSLLSSVDGYRSLLTVFNNLEYIQLALSDEAAPLLGVVVGFNSTDGD
ncbi:hypothetical protein A8L45_16905 [Veronia pacifica]|uniref:Imelysin-like domain-containing protein n=2 Tax=Veronia pacifica TaxID=1080227 RepID=A0A1C3EE20_9GAMM|nr:hypothetical protein A8L45_16905 [Veronia pacifica]